jgi:hypothetical protein
LDRGCIVGLISCRPCCGSLGGDASMTEDSYSYWAPEDFADDPWCDDMSKAPTDGTRFIAVEQFTGIMAVMRYATSVGQFVVAWSGDWAFEPTHWMPLPNPPRAK